MGLLTQGKPYGWKESEPFREYVKKHGIIQLINVFKKLQDRKHDKLLWGDEIECLLVKFDEKNKTAKLALKGAKTLAKLQEVSKDWPADGRGSVIWHPEYGRYMVESTPGEPYGGRLKDFLLVEANMQLRREQATKCLDTDERLMTVTVFPRLGCPHFTLPDLEPSPLGDVSRSIFFPDDAINEHPRFATLTANIRRRRGRKVAINVPVYHDDNTPKPFIENYPETEGDTEGAKAALPDHIYMDAMGFGMGNCAVQVTFQARHVEEARDLYDMLTPVCPILLALSASSPIFRGHLADVDARWDIIAASVDCRKPEELGEVPPKPPYRRIPKSRYGSVSTYISTSPRLKDKYNDIDLVIDEEVRSTLQEHGFDERLARHFAHLFIRDPMVIYENFVDELDDTTHTEHFENIQSTNWQTMRFKPPPVDKDIGWRVEFRPCEVQITDFENAALVTFVVLLSRTILSLNLNMYMPISKVDENMDRSQKRDAVLEQKFWFREVVVDEPMTEEDATRAPDSVREMTIDEIMNGKDDGFPGLIPLVEMYLRSMRMEMETRCRIQSYLSFLSKRASGQLKTTARWMRDFVRAHPSYKKDSVVTDEINYDLLMEIDRIAQANKPDCFEATSCSLGSTASASS